MEVLAGVGHQLAVGRMIQGFHTDHLVHQFVVVFVDVLDKLQLGLRRPDHKDFVRALQQFADMVIVGMVFLRVAGSDCTALVVLMRSRPR